MVVCMAGRWEVGMEIKGNKYVMKMSAEHTAQLIKRDHTKESSWNFRASGSREYSKSF